jgi:hypothetical protein
MPLKLGKLAATHDPQDLLFAHYRTTELTEAPTGYGHTALVKDPWGMLGNDEYGDCAEAGPCHETMLWNAAAGKQVQFTAQNALAAYSAITGFNPDDPSSDQGSNVRDVLKYRVKTGFTDSTGLVHKIGAYVALEPGNWEELLEALFCFEAVGIGIQFPSSAMTQFNKGKPWSVVSGAQIEGGHYVPVVGKPSSSDGECVTWGAIQRFTKSFYVKYCDEAWGVVSPEALAGGKTLEGLDLTQLQADLAAL